MIKSSGSCPGILPAVAEDEPYKVRHGDVDLNRLQWLENELEMFKGKMLEMRSAADTLSKEVRVSCRSPAPRGGDSLSTTDTSTPEEKVLESIKHVLREEECDRSQKGQKELMEEVRQLRQALRLESEARTQLSSKMEVVLTVAWPISTGSIQVVWWRHGSEAGPKSSEGICAAARAFPPRDDRAKGRDWQRHWRFVQVD
ncbi:unnamed protein product [Durusdinium trenchii]|uniref:Uncharacterized protein n=1 Tax=Durusdinium trenchii TaxID=1381693 RepID=A0ABP0JDP7_9DINO